MFESLSGLVGAFKTTSSKLIHQLGFLNFAWQRSFHDHIIRNEKAYENIANYIEKNPVKWEDTYFYYEKMPLSRMNTTGLRLFKWLASD